MELSQYVKLLPMVTRLRSRGYESLFFSPAGYGLFRGVFETFRDARGSWTVGRGGPMHLVIRNIMWIACIESFSTTTQFCSGFD